MPPIGVLTRIRCVDAGATSTAEHGSLTHPYHTIQAAVDAIGFPSTVAESAEDWAILIAPGDYNEDVAISGPVRLALIGLGAFRLGRYTVAGGTQTNIVAVSQATPRNVVWTYDKEQMIADGAAPQLVIGTIDGTEVVRHGKPIANRISGSVVVQGTAGGPGTPAPSGGTAFLAIANTQVDAGITRDPNAPNGETAAAQPAVHAVEVEGTEYRAFDGALVDRHFCSRFRGDILGALNQQGGAPAYVLATSFMSRYEGLVQVTQYASVDQAAFAEGMTVARAPGLGSLLSIGPPGIVNSTFAGVFTGTAGSLLLDGATNTWFLRNGGSLAGGATKAFLGEASPSRLVSGGTSLGSRDHGITLLVDASGGAVPVTLPSAAGKDDLTFTIKNVSPAGATVVVSPTGNEKIDGASSFSLHPPPTPAESVIKVVANGGGWWIVARG